MCKSNKYSLQEADHTQILKIGDNLPNVGRHFNWVPPLLPLSLPRNHSLAVSLLYLPGPPLSARLPFLPFFAEPATCHSPSSSLSPSPREAAASRSSRSRLSPSSTSAAATSCCSRRQARARSECSCSCFCCCCGWVF
jgi:hypothetical protein